MERKGSKGTGKREGEERGEGRVSGGGRGRRSLARPWQRGVLVSGVRQ